MSEIDIQQIMPKRGAFIVIEGLDRCGKSTQLDRLVDFCNTTLFEECNSKGLISSTDFISLKHFPDRDTPTGKQIDLYLRRLLELTDDEIHTLYAQNRAEIIPEIKTLIQSGTTVICSRYAFSGVAYTSAKGYPVHQCMTADAGILQPDIVLYLDGEPGELAKRAGFGDERYEDVAFQVAVRSRFQQIISSTSELEWKILDAMKSIDLVSLDIQKAVHDVVLSTLNGERVMLEDALFAQALHKY